MDRVIAAQVYMRICELGSLSAAARALGMSRPMVSRYLEQMEQWAGTRLVHRSTRKLTLTAAGEKVLQKTRTLCSAAIFIALNGGTFRIKGKCKYALCKNYRSINELPPLRWQPVTQINPRSRRTSWPTEIIASRCSAVYAPS